LKNPELFSVLETIKNENKGVLKRTNSKGDEIHINVVQVIPINSPCGEAITKKAF
jgi:hypothetical protein